MEIGGNLAFNRKGDATDIIFFGVIIFFLAVALVVAIFVNTILSNVISTTALNESAAAPSILTAFTHINETVTQRGYVLMFSLLIIGQLVSAFLVRIHPIFIFIYLFTLVMSIINAVFLSNLYQAIIENGQLAAIASNYTMITYIMQHAIKILIAVGSLAMIVTFTKLAQPQSFSGGDL